MGYSFSINMLLTMNKYWNQYFKKAILTFEDCLFVLLSGKISVFIYYINKNLFCIVQIMLLSDRSYGTEGRVWSTKENEKSINQKDIAASLRENITENRRRITAVRRPSVLNIQKLSIRRNKKCVQKNFFNFSSFSGCQNADFCTTYMKGKIFWRLIRKRPLRIGSIWRLFQQRTFL